MLLSVVFNRARGSNVIATVQQMQRKYIMRPHVRERKKGYDEDMLERCGTTEVLG